MKYLLTPDPNKVLGPMEALKEGGLTLIIGMASVFAVLIIIWISLIVLKYFMHDLPEKRKTVTKAAPVEIPVAPVVKNTNDDEIVAVIAAAIAMAESENSDLKFRVVSFRRK